MAQHFFHPAVLVIVAIESDYQLSIHILIITKGGQL